MKFTILSTNRVVHRTFDTEPQSIPVGCTSEQISDEQAATVQAGREATPRVLYFLIDGTLKTLAEKIAIERAASITPAQRIKLAEAHIGASFSSFLLMDGLKRIGEHKEAGTLASIPKTIAVATWVETVKRTALAGSVTFPPAPHTFEEVVSE